MAEVNENIRRTGNRPARTALMHLAHQLRRSANPSQHEYRPCSPFARPSRRSPWKPTIIIPSLSVEPRKTAINLKSHSDQGLPPNFGGTSGVSLDLGCGSRPRNPTGAKHLIGLDVTDRPSALSESVEYVRCLAGFEPIPLADESVDVCTGYDFLEHVPRTEHRAQTLHFPFIELMNEIWRVLRPNGFLIALTPAFPMSGAFVDPTHVNVITKETVDYFSGECHARGLGYGFTGNSCTVANTWIPYSSGIWQKGGSQSPTPVDWNRELRRMRRSRFAYEASFRKPMTHHLLWVLKKCPRPESSSPHE